MIGEKAHNNVGKLSLNMNALRLVNVMMKHEFSLQVRCFKLENGTRLIDAGVKAPAGIKAGLLISEISMGRLGHASSTVMNMEGENVPAVFVSTSHPALATLGAQMGSLELTPPEFSAIISGPVRALLQTL